MRVLTHLAMHVRDLDACIVFYQDFCHLVIVHERGEGAARVVWLAEPGRERELIFVLLPGGPGRAQGAGDFSHLGFSCSSRGEVDEIAAAADAAACLVWPPREEPYPLGYYCGVRDPDGHLVEFSYGQPSALGPSSSAT